MFCVAVPQRGVDEVAGGVKGWRPRDAPEENEAEEALGVPSTDDPYTFVRVTCQEPRRSSLEACARLES